MTSEILAEAALSAPPDVEGGQLWLALLQFADRKVQEVEQEGLSSRGQIQVLPSRMRGGSLVITQSVIPRWE